MPRSSFFIAFACTLLLATGYFYSMYTAICAWPITYQVGDIDERFNLSRAEATDIVATAVATWETGVGDDLFEVSDDAELTVNFIFDDRQELTEAERRARDRLAAVEAQSADVQVAYETKVLMLNAREAEYMDDLAVYERDLSRYNQTVASYNDDGGAPPEVFDELESERMRLEAVQATLDAEIEAINALVAEINELGAAGNVLVSRFNETVDTFNTTFADGREFTQGDYQGERINIYSFADQDELYTVLVHEFGHALGVAHVPEEDAFMHYILSEQNADAPLTQADIQAFAQVCSAKERLQAVPQPYRTLFTWLGL